MAYLLDSDWFIDYLYGGSEARELIDGLADSGIAISVITYMEAYEGVERSERSREAASRLERVIDQVPLLVISPAVAQRCARLRHTLRTLGRRVNARALDLLIAASALEHSL